MAGRPAVTANKAQYSHIDSQGGIGPNVDRTAAAPAEVQAAFIWPVGFGPKSIRIRLKDGTAGDLAKIVFDAPSAAIATAWIADDGSLTTNRMYRVIHNIDAATAISVGDEGWTNFDFSAPLENLYYDGDGTLGAGTVLEVEGN